jgi:hypothetical protein
LYVIVADADAFFRDESPADLFRTFLDFEEFRAIDGAPGGFDFVQEERNRRVVAEDVVEFRLALFWRHNFSSALGLLLLLHFFLSARVMI